MKEPFKSKQFFKRKEGKCRICGETDYILLDTHRIIPGREYSNHNCVCVCTTCHRLIHNGKIKIVGYKHSTMGKLLYFIDENGKEHFNP